MSFSASLYTKKKMSYVSLYQLRNIHFCEYLRKKKKIILLTVFFCLVGNLIILVIKNPSLSLVRSLNLNYKRKVIYAFHIFLMQAWE